MRARRLLLRLALVAACAPAAFGCGSGPPRHRADGDPRRIDAPPPPPRDERPFGGSVEVRIGLHWERGTVRVSSSDGLVIEGPDGSLLEVPGGMTLALSAEGGGSDVRFEGGGTGSLAEGPGPWSVLRAGSAPLQVGKQRVRGRLLASARSDSLFVVNALALEDYLRGVVPREIGPRPAAEREAVAAQAVAARTYTLRKLGQYGSLPFDLYASVQDQAYDGIDGENAVADEAIRETRGLVLVDGNGPIETFYSSTCGGRRSDIAAVWPHRTVHPALRGGPDGPRGREWCRASPHFEWRESWSGDRLGALFREHAPAQLELPPGSVKGELVDVRIRDRGPSGRASRIEYRTKAGTWSVPGDRNRWILRRSDGGILRSVWIDLDVERRGGRLVRVVAEGRGNGHGVGMCQVGAIGRARDGQGFREILRAYYPKTKLRPIRGSDLPPGRGGGA
jgi:stage II sporulation protein D